MESSAMNYLVELHFDLGYFSLIMYLDERPSSGSISMMHFHICFPHMGILFLWIPHTHLQKIFLITLRTHYAVEFSQVVRGI